MEVRAAFLKHLVETEALPEWPWFFDEDGKQITSRAPRGTRYTRDCRLT